MDTISRRDLDYLDGLHPKLAVVLARIDEEGGREGIPVVGTAVGRCLRVLVGATGARRVLEIGTAIGYSTIWMGGALPSDGELVTIDPDRTRTARAEASWREARIQARLRIENAPALDVLSRLRETFDLAFIDAIKTEYAAYLEGVLPLLRDGGTVCADNLLWQGKASGSQPADDADTRAIRSFNERFVRHPSLLATILPVGDGLGLGVKRR